MTKKNKKKVDKSSKKNKDKLLKDKLQNKNEKVKKTKKEKSKEKKVGFFRRIFNFFKELKSEMKKIVWPTKKSVFNSTMIVMFAILVMTLFVVFADMLFQSLIKILFRNL